MKLPYILVSSLLTTALATPSPTNTETQASSLCSQWATATTGSYLIYNNLWGEGSASSGKQCTTVDSLTSNKLAWHTSWSWAGGSSSVKSFANAAYQFSGKKLADVDSIKTSWDWRYSLPFLFSSRFPLG